MKSRPTGFVKNKIKCKKAFFSPHRPKIPCMLKERESAMAGYILFLHVANPTKYATTTLDGTEMALGRSKKVENISVFVNTLKH